jgi:hypothetical protein
MDHGMETRMRLRGHFIGALTSAFISIACASANAKSTDAALISTAFRSQINSHFLETATAAGGATVNAMMEDPT